MKLSPIVPIGILLGIMLSASIYPKQTMIVAAVVSAAILLYPLIMIVQASNLCACVR